MEKPAIIIEGTEDLIDEQGAEAKITKHLQENEHLQEIEEMRDLLTSAQLAARVGIGNDQVHDWLMNGHIVGWVDVEGNHVFPAGQFDENGQPIRRLECITQLFDNPYEMWYWLNVPNDALGGKVPLVLLHKGEVARVEAAANGYLQGDFA